MGTVANCDWLGDRFGRSNLERAAGAVAWAVLFPFAMDSGWEFADCPLLFKFEAVMHDGVVLGKHSWEIPSVLTTDTEF